MTEAVCSSEMFAADVVRYMRTNIPGRWRQFVPLIPTYQTTRCHNPEDHNMNLYHHENLKSHLCHWVYNSSFKYFLIHVFRVVKYSWLISVCCMLDAVHADNVLLYSVYLVWMWTQWFIIANANNTGLLVKLSAFIQLRIFLFEAKQMHNCLSVWVQFLTLLCIITNSCV
jgi:hypothetical protein